MMLTVPSALPAAQTASTPPSPADVAVFQSTAAALAGADEAGATDAGATDATDAGATDAGADDAGAGLGLALPLHAATTTVAAARTVSTRDFISMRCFSSVG